jgi:fumarylacetoacetate (FAA) hydrolase
MKLGTVEYQGVTHAGVLLPTGFASAQQLLCSAAPLPDLRALLELPDAIERLRQSLQGDRPPVRALDTLRPRPPVLQPPTIRDFMCYEGHASMGGKWKLPDAWYRLPVFYFSNPLCVFGDGDAIPLPSATRKFDFELEIAAVIGRAGSNIAAAEAMDYVAGFTILNDWSSRDLQRDEMAASLGPAKGKDTATSLGPWLVTPDELGPLLAGAELRSRCSLRVNGEEWVRGECAGMQHDWADMIERAARDSRIVPGDVIGSGTIVGGSVAEAIRLGLPARYLEPGDQVEVEVEGLGVLRNSIAAPQPLPANYRYAAPRATGKPS